MTIFSLAGTVPLAGCDTGSGQFAPACPQRSLLADAADVTLFRPSGQDITDTILDGRITGLNATCSSVNRNLVRAKLSVVAQLTRGPAAQGRRTSVPYIVAVTDSADNPLDREEFAFAATFPANVDTITVTGDEITLNFPVSPDRSAAAYKILVGFNLTPAELAYNRARGPR
jgi:hypothetical protein